MEQLEIHSKSYIVRWIKAQSGHTISWSIQPHKKSINFGVFKHNAPTQGSSPHLPINASPATTPGESPDTTSRRQSAVKDNDASGVIDKLEKLGMKKVVWTGKCEADRVSMGRYDVPDGESGMYGLVFDNTFAKQFSKTVTFVLMTYPTGSAPKSGHHMHFAQASTASSGPVRGSSGKSSPNLIPVGDSNDDLAEGLDPSRVVLADPRPKTTQGTESFYTGVLHKKRRRRNQGYARRFFSLDYTSSTLSYYRNRHSSGLRGAIPLSLAAVATEEKSRIISIDSGAEVWILKAHNKQDFEGWRETLERAAEVASTPRSPRIGNATSRPLRKLDPADEREWSAVEALVGRVSGITDGVRRLAKDTDPKYSPQLGLGINNAPGSPAAEDSDDYFGQAEQAQPEKRERKSLFRRKSSSRLPSPSFGRSISAGRLAPPSPVPTSSTPAIAKRGSHQPELKDPHIHDNCMALLRDLEGVVAEFSSLVAESRRRRVPPERPQADPRSSIDSTRQEFFDAEEPRDDGVRSPIMTLRRDADLEEALEREDDDVASVNSASTISNADAQAPTRTSTAIDGAAAAAADAHALFPSRPRNTYPLPHSPITRRSTIPPSKGAPPSLIAFLRKNVGKDLSTIAMPVTANEPLSLLQRQAETMASARLLTTAAALTDPDASALRLLHVTAFALSSLSSTRARERATRKPFNPMLGETFELVREDLGLRFLAEKVSHRPVRIASRADGPAWSLEHTLTPSQKFWGKSAELISEGVVRITLFVKDDSTTAGAGGKAHREHYEYTPPQAFLRNILAGEKYVEPVGSMTVSSPGTPLRATATFKAGGMFSGRSEDVSVALHAPDSPHPLPHGLEGKWPAHLTLTHNGSPRERLWSAPPLLPDAHARYGLTAFAAELNQVTALESGGAVAPTDSRLRPDLREYEEGRVDEAEALKARLEEGQRRRRAEMEREGAAWAPRWFDKVGGGEGGEEVWRLKGHDREEDYWSVREAVVGFKRGRWDGVRDVFEV